MPHRKEVIGWWKGCKNGTWRSFGKISMLLTVMLLPSCHKRIPATENRVIDPMAANCSCKEITDLSHFIIIGDDRLARMIDKLNQCNAEGLIQNLKDFP